MTLQAYEPHKTMIIAYVTNWKALQYIAQF